MCANGGARGRGAAEQYMHQGKLLALDLLTRVLFDPHHSWSHACPQVGATLVCFTENLLAVDVAALVAFSS